MSTPQINLGLGRGFVGMGEIRESKRGKQRKKGQNLGGPMIIIVIMTLLVNDN